MRRSTICLAVVSVPVALAGVGFQAVQSGTWHDAELGTIRIDGICSLTENGANCWAIDGRPNAGFADKVTAEFTQKNNRFTIALGKKTRYVFLSWTDGQTNSLGQMQVRQGERTLEFRRTGTPIGASPGYARAQMEPTDTSFDLEIDLPIFRTLGTGALALEPGSKVAAGEASVSIRSVAEVGPERAISPGSYFSNSLKLWRIDLEGHGVDLALMRIDPNYKTKDNEAFQMVDLKGVPLPGAKLSVKNADQSRARVSLGQDIQGNIWLESTVNPKLLGPVTVTLQKSDKKTIRFANLAANASPQEDLR